MKVQKQIISRSPKMLKHLVLWSVMLVVVGFTMDQEDKFVLNPTESCQLEAAGGSKLKSSGYYVNGDKATLFNRMNEKEYIYLIPANEKVHVNNKNETTIRLSKYEIRESNGWFFMDDEKVGTVKQGDVIILYKDSKVHVYNQDRVSVQ